MQPLRPLEQSRSLFLASNDPYAEDVLMYDTARFQRLTFGQAAPIFIAFKKTHVAEGTIDMYKLYCRFLTPHFGKKRLTEITIQDIREYQAKRLAAQIVPAKDPHIKKLTRIVTYKGSAGQINHEVNMLKQILDRAGVWGHIRKWYKPLRQTEPEPPKTMTQDEEEAFFRVAASTPEWSIAYWVASLTANTSASGIELRKLTLGDIDLQSTPPKFVVPAGKNTEREGRVVPLNDTAYKQMAKIVERAITLGAQKAEHHVFPFRVKRNKWDVTRSASESWLKKQWKALTVASGVPWLKPHNLRFQCATRMVAEGVPPHTIKKQFGWKNLKMLEHYNRPQIDILYDAVRRIDTGKKQVKSALPAWQPKKSTGKLGA